MFILNLIKFKKLLIFFIQENMIRMENQRESILLYSKSQILNHLLLKNMLFTESIINLKFTLTMLREQFKFLIGEILPLLNSINYKTMAQALKVNSAELVLDLKDNKIPSTLRMLSEEFKLNFLMKFGDFITEMKLETFLPQKHTEMTTLTK